MLRAPILESMNMLRRLNGTAAARSRCNLSPGIDVAKYGRSRGATSRVHAGGGTSRWWAACSTMAAT
jgi:hypothetical protein